MIGSSNNPISGLTLSTVIIAALLMVALGVRGTGGVIAVLGVAAVVCVSSAVAGELLQDFKVGYIIGGTPRSIQIVELIAVVVASAVMYFPLLVLHQGNINSGGIGFGDKALPAPQAGLMASLSQGIVGGDMAWPLIIAGILFGVSLIMIGVKSPMLVAIGMYLPLGTTFAIFVGGMVRWVTDTIARRSDMNEAQKIRIESVGVLAASGLIAGEALMGLVTDGFVIFQHQDTRSVRSPVLYRRTGRTGGARIHADSGAARRTREGPKIHLRPRRLCNATARRTSPGQPGFWGFGVLAGRESACRRRAICFARSVVFAGARASQTDLL